MEKQTQISENKKPTTSAINANEEANVKKKKQEPLEISKPIEETQARGTKVVSFINNGKPEQIKPTTESNKNTVESKKEALSTQQPGDQKNEEGIKKPKKKESDLTQVLPNRSWVTNFYHNYTKAVERANLDPQLPKQVAVKNELEKVKPQVTKAVESPFNSILFVKPEKHDRAMLLTAKPDIAVIKAFREIINEGKEKSKEKDLQHSLAPSATKQKIDSKSTIEPDIKVKNASNLEEKAKEVKPTYSLKDIPVKQFEKLGINQEQLVKSGVLDKLLKGEKTIPIENIQIANPKGGAIAYAASFQLERKANGAIALKVNPIANKPDLKIPNKIAGTNISPEMKKELKEKKSVPLSRDTLSGKIMSLLVLDSVKNSIKIVKPKELTIPQEIKGVKLTPDQQTSLKEGKSIKLSGMVSKDNKTKFDAVVNVDMSKNTLKFANAVPSALVKETPVMKDRNSISKAEGKSVESSVTKKAESTKINSAVVDEANKQKPRGMKM